MDFTRKFPKRRRFLASPCRIRSILRQSNSVLVYQLPVASICLRCRQATLTLFAKSLLINRKGPLDNVCLIMNHQKMCGSNSCYSNGNPYLQLQRLWSYLHETRSVWALGVTLTRIWKIKRVIRNVVLPSFPIMQNPAHAYGPLQKLVASVSPYESPTSRLCRPPFCRPSPRTASRLLSITSVRSVCGIYVCACALFFFSLMGSRESCSLAAEILQSRSHPGVEYVRTSDRLSAPVTLR